MSSSPGTYFCEIEGDEAAYNGNESVDKVTNNSVMGINFNTFIVILYR